MNNEDLIKALEKIREVVGILIDYTRQKFGSELENLCGEWVQDDDPALVVRIHCEEGIYYLEKRKSNSVNGHVRVLTCKIASDEDSLYTDNGLELPIAYDRESDSLVIDTDVYKRKNV